MGDDIGNLLKSPFVLGPMAGVTDRPMRVISRHFGAGLVSMEMVSANAIKYGNKKTDEMISIGEDEHPIALQIFGPDPETMALAAEHVSKYPYDILDINMGCPMPKIVNNGEGSALMRNPELAGKIVEAVVKAQDRPVGVKIRAGFSKDEVNAVEVAKVVESAGASIIAVHGRTREQYYEGFANWDVIRDVKAAVQIPVIGNGDINSAEKALSMMDRTGCDYVMIGRASRGNPWIFSQCNALYNGTGEDEYSNPSIDLICDTIMWHARMQVEEKGPGMGILQMRKHVSWYISGYPNSAHVRGIVNTIGSFDELAEVIEGWRCGKIP